VRRLQLVVNHSAGGGRAAARLPAVEAALRSAGHDLVVTPTRSLEHADELATTAVADDRVVVAMGGDGIVGRVAGIVATVGGVMAALPGGRGNDFCRAAGVPADLPAACALLSSGRVRSLDLGIVTSATGEAPFLGIASIGFDSDVQERVLQSRLPLGQLVYLVSSFAAISRWRPAQFSCTVDGAPLEVRGWAVAVANSGVYGSGMRLAPDASMEDGLLDVVSTAATGRPRFARSLPKVFRGTHVEDASVTVRPGRVVELTADRPFRVFADGDPVGSLPCTVTVRPGAVRVVLPDATTPPPPR
jgi:YegS/Rv2252/BmrU family lipid kinase